MKKIMRLLTLLLCCIYLSGCEDLIFPSKEITTVDHSLDGYDFSGLDASGVVKVYIAKGETQSMKIEANENLHKYIQVTRKDGKLGISLKNIRIKRVPTINIYLTLNHLNNFVASGASSIICQEKIEHGKISLAVSGASHLEGEMVAENLDISLSGASSVDLKGHAGMSIISCSGASSLSAQSFDADKLILDLSGASFTSITVNNTLRVSASGASLLHYWGDPVIESMEVTGASTVLKK